MKESNAAQPDNRSPPKPMRAHRPFILTSKALRLSNKVSVPEASTPVCSPMNTSLMTPAQRNGSQSDIKFEIVSQTQMEGRVDQLNRISIGQKRRKTRHSANATTQNRQAIGYWGYPEDSDIPDKNQRAVQYKCPENILDQLIKIQQQAGEDKRTSGQDISDELARLDRLDRDAKCKTPNIINMEFAFTVKKTISERTADGFKKKNKSVDPKNQTSQNTSQYEPPATADQPLLQAQPIVYEFKDLQNARYNYRDRLIVKQQRLKSSLNRVQLSPIKKFTNELTQYIHRQYLNIQRLKPVAKNSQSTNPPSTPHVPPQVQQQCQGLLIRNIISQEEEKRDKAKSLAYDSTRSPKITFKANRKDKEAARANSQDRKRAQKQHNDFTMTRRNFNKKDYFVFGLSDRPAPENNKVELYRDFLWKINYSNGLFVQPVVELERNYKVYIGRGNNSMLLKGLLKRRFWWAVVDKVDDGVHFIWTQLKNNDYIKGQKSYSKMNNYSNSKIYSSSVTLNTVQTNSDTQSTTPCSSRIQKKAKSPEHEQSQARTNRPKIPKQNKQTQPLVKDQHELIFGEGDLALWSTYYLKHQKLEESLNQRIYAKRATLLRAKNALKIQTSDSLRVHNHFNSNFFIGNKKALFYSMRKYYELSNLNVFEFLPLTFHISKGVDDPEYAKFLKYYTQIQESKGENKGVKNIWIVKPGEFTNRGTGITVCSSLDDVRLRLRGRERNMNGKYRTFIVQKYLERPLLYQRRKFDIRHYMMLTCINGSFKGYWYEQGYIRTTSYEYNIKNCKDNLVHLTNDAIQKHTDDYGKFEKGNKISYEDFQKYLDTNYRKSNFDFINGILPQMKRICTDAIRASYFLLDPDRKTHNFEIFGMDFMIDEEFKPWLIEINTNPCLQLCCPLLSKIIPAMVENALKIGLDPLFPPPYNWPQNKKYQLGDNPIENNKFVLVFDEAVEGDAIQELYRNIDKVDKNMGDIQEKDEEFEDEGKEWNEEI